MMRPPFRRPILYNDPSISITYTAYAVELFVTFFQFFDCDLLLIYLTNCIYFYYYTKLCNI